MGTLKSNKLNLPKISELDISSEMPEYEDSKEDYKDLVQMFKRMVEDQKTGLELMERYIKVIEYKLNKQ